jgi:hypothetical protein
MGGQKPKVYELPQQQQQQTTNTFGTYSIANTPEARSLLNTPLDFGQGSYSGDAYKDIKNDFKFSIDPGAGRRTDLAEQANQNRWNSSFFGGMPQEYRQLLRDSDSRQIRSQGVAERQQAEFAQQNAQQQADYQSSLARAGMRDQAELNRANMAGQATTADLERRRLLLPQILQTGGSGTSSGYTSQLSQPTPGFLSNLAGGLGAVGGAAITKW